MLLISGAGGVNNSVPEYIEQSTAYLGDMLSSPGAWRGDGAFVEGNEEPEKICESENQTEKVITRRTSSSNDP